MKNMSNRSKKDSGSFGQIYCLNGRKIKDDIANFTRPYIRAVVYINFGRENSMFEMK
jgi:hypothetical protein